MWHLPKKTPQYGQITASSTSEPILVESESDVQAEDILLDKSGSRILHPLAADIQLRTVVVGVHDRNTETGTYRKLLRAIHAVHLIIWCSKAHTGTCKPHA